MTRKHNHYFKDVSHLDTIDVYRVIQLWEVNDNAVAHALKKLLVAGKRGAKDYRKDLTEAKESIERALEMLDEDGTPVPAETEPETPWYPDNSGEWVEIGDESIPGIQGSIEIEALTLDERMKKKYFYETIPARNVNWACKGGVVAYKLVK